MLEAFWFPRQIVEHWRFFCWGSYNRITLTWSILIKSSQWYHWNWFRGAATAKYRRPWEPTRNAGPSVPVESAGSQTWVCFKNSETNFRKISGLSIVESCFQTFAFMLIHFLGMKSKRLGWPVHHLFHSWLAWNSVVGRKYPKKTWVSFSMTTAGLHFVLLTGWKWDGVSRKSYTNKNLSFWSFLTVFRLGWHQFQTFSWCFEKS